MKKVTFNIRNINTGKLEPLTGHKIKLTGCILYAHKEIWGWRLTESRSGAMFLEAEKPNESLKSCIKRAKERIEEYGIADINARIEKAIQKFGEANANTIH